MPKITRLERQKHRQGRISVFIDEEFAFGLYEETVLRFSLKPDVEVDENLLAALQESDLYVHAKQLAGKRLSARMRAEMDIRSYLSGKGIPEHIVEETINVLYRVQLLDDEEYARAFVRDRQRFKAKSVFLLRKELKAKGIAVSVIDTVLAEFDQDDESIAKELAVKWLTRHSTLEAATATRRLVGFLERRGFSKSVIITVLNETTENSNG